MSRGGVMLSVWLDRCVPEMTYDEAVAYVVARYVGGHHVEVARYVGGHHMEVPPDVWDALCKRLAVWIFYPASRKFMTVAFSVGAPITVFQAERGLP